MKTYFNKPNRSIVYEFPLAGDPIGDGPGQPTLKVSVSHYKFAKAIIANISYIEKDFGPGYAIDKWQSDWPLIRIGTKPTARYSEKALKEFAAEILADVEYGQYDNPTINALIARRITEEVAA